MREQWRRARRLCHVPKMLDQFHANNSNADKHDTRCKACCAEYEKQKRAKKTRVHEPTVADKKCRCVRSAARAASHLRLHPGLIPSSITPRPHCDANNIHEARHPPGAIVADIHVRLSV